MYLQGESVLKEMVSLQEKRLVACSISLQVASQPWSRPKWVGYFLLFQLYEQLQN